MPWAPDYALLADLKAFVRIDDTDDDAQLALAISAASRAIDHATGRQFGNVGAPELRTYPARWSPNRCTWIVDIDDLMTQAGLVVSVSGTPVTDFTLTPLNNAQKGRPWTALQLDSVQDTVEVTADWGWTTVPTTIIQATLLQASRFFTRREAPFGVAGSPDVGSELRLLDKVDADVAVMVRDYRRGWPFL